VIRNGLAHGGLKAESARMRVRDIWFEVHKYIGLATMAFLVVAGGTGCALVFRGPLDAWLNRDLFQVAVAPALAPAELARRLELERPDLKVVKLPLVTRPGHAEVMSVEGRGGARLSFDQVFVDPASGRVIGTRKDVAGWGRRGLMHGVYDLHSTLAAGTAGRWVMGLAAAAWLVSNGVGIYLTLPRRAPFWSNWRPLWTIGVKARLPRQLLDLHRASGLWLFPVLTVLALTSVGLNFYYELAAPIAEALSPPRASPFDDTPPKAPADHPPKIGWSQAIAHATRDAARRAPGWRPVNALYLPDRGLYGLTLTHSGDDDYAGLGLIGLYYRDDTGAFVYRDDPGRDSAGRAALRSLYPLHTGEVFGWPTRLLVFVLGAATVEMSVTGLYLWLKRRGARNLAARSRRGAEARAS